MRLGVQLTELSRLLQAHIVKSLGGHDTVEEARRSRLLRAEHRGADDPAVKVGNPQPLACDLDCEPRHGQPDLDLVQTVLVRAIDADPRVCR